MCLTGQLRHTDACDKGGFLDVCCRACLAGTPPRPWHSGRGSWGIGLAKLIFGVDAKIRRGKQCRGMEIWQLCENDFITCAVSHNTCRKWERSVVSQTPHALRSTSTSGMCAQSHRSVPCGARECLRRDRGCKDHSCTMRCLTDWRRAV